MSEPKRSDNAGDPPPATGDVRTGGGAVVLGNVEIGGGDFVGRDKIVNNIQNIYQRALTAAEEAKQAQAIEVEYLAHGVSAYVERLQARASEVDDTGGPYKGLLEYRLSDAEIFFGREQDTREVLQLLDRHPLTVLHSESGAGKTSLLEAGVSPHLIAGGHLPVCRRPYDVAPTLAIKQAFLPNLSVAPGLAAASLRDFLWQVCNILGPHTTLYIFLDQFEEFFTHLDQATHAGFVRELAECLDDETLDARWVLALRTEFFGNLATFRPRIRNPFENDYRLSRLTRDQAQAVITRPAERYGIGFEAGVVDTLLDDLGQTEIAPPQIQLVCSALYGELGNEKAITRELYDREGGAAGILRGHLERVLSRDVPAPQRTTARRLLEALISSELRRLIRTHAGLAAELVPQGVAPEALDATLAQLVDSRLLRVHGEGAEGGELSYELAHDYLLDEIKLDPAVQARKAAQELLDREVQSYVRHGTLLSEDKWAIVEPRRSELVLSDEATTLLDRSERAIKRRQRFVLGGIGLVAALIIVGVISVITAIGAQGAAQTARSLQATSEAGAATASAREASANASASNAATREALAATNEAAAIRREAIANQALKEAFRQTGVVPVGSGPSALAFDAAGNRLWVTNSGNDTVQAIDPETGEIVQTLQVGRNPNGLLFDAPHGRLWVANTDDGTVQSVDPESGQLGDPIQVISRPVDLSFRDERLWVVGEDERGYHQAAWLQLIDPATGQVTEPIPISGHSRSALAFDGTRLWIGDGQAVEAVDPDTGERLGQTASSTYGGFPAALTFDGRRVWVLMASLHGYYGLHAIDPETGTIGESVFYGNLGAFGTDEFVVSLAFDGTRLWIADQSNDTLVAVDPDTGMESALIPVGGDPLAVTAARGRLWVAQRADNTVKAIVPMAIPSAPVEVGVGAAMPLAAGDRLWIANPPGHSVVAIDLTDGAVGVPIWTENQPTALAYDGQWLWVANFTTQTVQAITPATGDKGPAIEVDGSPTRLAFDTQRLWVAYGDKPVVQALDPDTGEVLSTIPVDDGVADMIFDGERLWVSYDSLNVQAIDPRSGAKDDPIEVGVYLGALVFDGGRLWVTNQLATTTFGNVKAVDPATQEVRESDSGGNSPAGLASDGQRLWVAYLEDNAVQAIDLATGSRVITILVGREPVGLAFDGKRVWVANMEDGTVQAIYPTLGGVD
jgi:YVTN family beta-propeller protein